MNYYQLGLIAVVRHCCINNDNDRGGRAGGGAGKGAGGGAGKGAGGGAGRDAGGDAGGIHMGGDDKNLDPGNSNGNFYCVDL